MCVFADMITIECAFRRCLWLPLGDRSLAFALPLIPDFRFPLSRVEIRNIELLVWDI
jgi:hypothetical protein